MLYCSDLHVAIGLPALTSLPPTFMLMSTSNLPEHSQPDTPKDGRPLLVILIALCSIFVFTYALRLDTRDEIEAAIVAQQETNAAAVARTAQLEREYAQVEKPAHADTLIRTLLQMGKPGEQVLVGVSPPSVTGAVPLTAAPTLPHINRAIWEQWFHLLFPSD